MFDETAGYELEVDDEISFKTSAPNITDNVETPVRACNRDENTPSQANSLSRDVTPNVNGLHKMLTAKYSVPTPVQTQGLPTPYKSCGALPASLLSMYVTDEHLPKYSQAELDAAIAQAVQTASEGEGMAQSQEISQLQVKIRSLETNNAEYVNKIAQLESNLKKSEDENNVYKVQSRALAHKLQAIEADMQKTNADTETKSAQQLAQVSSELLRAKQEHQQQLEQQKQQITTRFSEQTKTLESDYQQQIQTLHLQLKQMDEKLVEAVAEAKAKVYEKVKLQFENGNKEFQKIKTALKDATADIETKSVEISTLKERVNEFEKLTESQQQTLSKEAKQGDQLKQLVCGLYNSLVSFANSAKSTAASSENEIAATSATEADTVLSSFRGIIDKLREQMQTYSQVIQTLTETNLNLNEALAYIKTSEESSKQKIEQLFSLNTGLQSQLATQSADLHNITADRDQQMNVVATLTSKITTLEIKIETLQKEAIEASDRANGLRSMNEELLAMLESNVQ